jgi:adenosylcobinamide kinase/adenosylcobinamide-phosphate guanylyltransferase
MQQIHHHSVTLVLGGVRSGKSRLAQQIASAASRVTFIATAPRSGNDAEMTGKIDRHIADRPNTWTTIEEPLHLADAIQSASAYAGAILVDCLTLFASNLMSVHHKSESESEYQRDANHPEVAALCAVLAQPPCEIVLVSNEVGSGIVPAFASGRQFRDLLGEINQRVAAVAGNVLFMVAGLPLVLKGTVPKERPR